MTNARILSQTALFSAAILSAPFALVAAASAQDAASVQTPADIGARIEETRATLERWVECRRILSEEMRDWSLGKDMLDSRVDMLKGEVGEVEGRIVEAEKSVTGADRTAAELVAKNDALKSASSEFASVASALETRTKELVKRLPDPIREKIRPLTQRLPDDPAKSELALSTRFQNVVGIINEVNKFSREITVTSEVRKLADGSSAEVTAVYLGLAQGYYVGGGGKLAGVGGASDSGWTWTPANDYALQIAKVVAILKNESPAEFVPVPLGVK